MWFLGTPVILILVCYISLCDAQVILHLCDAPIKDEICVLVCQTPDLTQSVVFKKDNTEYASCKFILGTLSCTSIYPARSLISQQPGSPANTSLNITQLSRAGDQGSWTCDYGSTGSTAQTLTVLTAPSQRATSGGLEINFCTDSERDSEDVTLTVTCSSAVNVLALLNSATSDQNHTDSVPVTKGAACSDVAENIYTAVFTIANDTGNLMGDNYKLYFEVQLLGGVGPVYETVYPGNITFPCPITTTTTGVPPVPVHVSCTCTVTIVLGWALSVVFTPICMVLAGVILIKFMNIDIVDNIKKEMVCYIIIIIACVVLSCGLGGGVTHGIMSGHDKGNEPDCSCMIYIGFLLPLVFAAVLAGIFILVWRCLNSRKEKESGKREDPEGKEEKPKVADAPVVSDKPPKAEKDNGKKQDNDKEKPPALSPLSNVRAKRPLPRSPMVLLPKIGSENETEEELTKKKTKRRRKKKQVLSDEPTQTGDLMPDNVNVDKVARSDDPVERRKKRKKRVTPNEHPQIEDMRGDQNVDTIDKSDEEVKERRKKRKKKKRNVLKTVDSSREDAND